MKIFLSNHKPSIDNYIWINNLSQLNDSVLQSEATEIICEDFLSSFAINEQQELLNKITEKLRLNSKLIISEVDCGLITKRFYLEEINLAELNEKMFSGKRKSILSVHEIIKNLPDKLQVNNKHFQYNECKIILTCRRHK
jgi:hypothetical protein